MAKFIISSNAYKVIKSTFRDKDEVGWLLFAKKRDKQEDEHGKKVDVYDVIDAIVGVKSYNKEYTKFDEGISENAKKRADKEGLIIIRAHSHPTLKGWGYRNFHYFLPSKGDIDIYIKRNEFMCLVTDEGSILNLFNRIKMRFYSFKRSSDSLNYNRKYNPGLMQWAEDDKEFFPKILKEINKKFEIDLTEYDPMKVVGYKRGNPELAKKYDDAEEFLKEKYKLESLQDFKMIKGQSEMLRRKLFGYQWMIHEVELPD